jgi:hypothetical protein
MRKGFAAALTLLAASACAGEQVRLNVVAGGKKIGQAVATQKVLASGVKLVQLTMQLAGRDGKTVSIRMESSYAASGAPLRKFQETVTSEPRTRRAVTAEFDKEGARVVEEVGGKRTVKVVPLAAGAPTQAKSEFWFVRDKPVKGATDKYYHFNVSGLTWELTTVVYEGQQAVTIGGKKVTGHVLKQTRGTAFLDAQGLPLRLDLGEIVLERASEG